MIKDRKIITLCGSTKFKDLYERYNKKLTLEGNVVLNCGLFAHAEHLNLAKEQKEDLDYIHRLKIRLSDEIFVINPLGYIGESTSHEIAFAKSLGKKVEYMVKRS